MEKEFLLVSEKPEIRLRHKYFPAESEKGKDRTIVVITLSSIVSAIITIAISLSLHVNIVIHILACLTGLFFILLSACIL